MNDSADGVDMSNTTDPTAKREPSIPSLVARGSVGGILMGLANLVPGISGGTMLVAAGVYTRFIDALAELSTFKFRKQSIVLLLTVVVAAALSIVLFAGQVKTLVVDHRWVMYSLFIGLTLGGLPVVWKLVDRATRGVWVGAGVGFLVMAAVAVFQASGAGAQGDADAGWVLMFFAGIAGASAMILPGISGGYLLLVLGVYVTILGAIDQCKSAVKLIGSEGVGSAMAAMRDPLIGVVLPVGVGVVIGVVAVSNLLKWLLHRYERPTLGVLLGLLVGAVIGLWPFQEGVAPKVGDTFKGQVVTVESLAEIPAEKYPTVTFTPSVGQVAGSIGLIIAGFAATSAVALLGREKQAAK
jgi:putative membrane protein